MKSFRVLKPSLITRHLTCSPEEMTELHVYFATRYGEINWDISKYTK